MDTSTTPSASAEPRHSWPRLHLIYFLLAGFDFVAILFGLWLSHRIATVFEDTLSGVVRVDAEYDVVGDVVDTGLALSEPAHKVFESKNPAQERASLASRFQEFEAKLAAGHAALKAGVHSDRHENHDHVTWPTLLDKAGYAARELTGKAQALLDRYAVGDRDGAAAVSPEIKERERELRAIMTEASATLDELTEEAARDGGTRLAGFQRYEYVIGALILIMVLCVAMYGSFVGRFLSQKYRELEEAHDAARKAEAETRAFAGELQTVNESGTNLNVELARNMKQLQEAQDEIVRKGRLAQLGQLTATVAHEIRNPLGTVRTATYLIGRKAADKAKDLQPLLDRINTGVTRCDRIITELLDFARSKSLQLETKPVDDWLARIVEEEGQKLPRQVKIECRPGLGGLHATFDPSRMQRVLVNLLTNASEAMVGKGEDAAALAAADPRIVVETRHSARGIEITVTDNGPGISEENQRKILEPLFTTKNFGVGLGLPAVEKILEQHGGGLEIASKLGEGASFTAWFPIDQAKAEAA